MKITRGISNSHKKVVLYGCAAVGKTTLASKFPNPIILDCERGSRAIDCTRCEPEDWLDFVGTLHELEKDLQGFETVVIDSVDSVEHFARDRVCSNEGKSNIQQIPYGGGYKMAHEMLVSVLDQLERIGKQAHVVLIGHSKIVRVSPPDELDSYDREELNLYKESSPKILEWADLVAFCRYDQRLLEGSDGRKKAFGGTDRVMMLERAAAYDAKNRFGMPAEMPLEIDSFSEILKVDQPKKRKRKTAAEKAQEFIDGAKSTEDFQKARTALRDALEKSRISFEQAEALTTHLEQREASLNGEVLNG